MESPEQVAPNLEPSSIVGETYRIDRHVAHGGSSVIYAARHVEMDRQVALKVLPLGNDVNASALERFSQEARLACQINHPNVVTIYQFGQDTRGLLYIAMEWLEGVSLSDAIEERGAFSPLRVAEIGREVARGLAAVHDHDVLHRDLKPSNVMLAELADWEEVAKLLDFGVAKSLAPTEEDQLRITQEGKFVGTPRYAAPELIRGEELTVRTDIYSTGLLMWEALTGEPAVSSVVFQKCCAQHLSDDPWRLPESIDCPPPLAEVIHRSLEKDSEDRFETCRDLAQALEGAVHAIASDAGSSFSAPVATTESVRGQNTYGSQWMKLLFAVAVGTAVLGLAGYQGWLTVTETTGSAEERPRDGVHNTASASDRAPPTSPDQLLEQLSAAGWSVADRSEAEDGWTRYRVEHTGDTATMEINRDPGRASSEALTLEFPDYSVRVMTDDTHASSRTLRLVADLWRMRPSD